MGESTEINFKKFVILGPVILFTEICPSGRVASSHLQQIFIFQKFLSENGRDEKGCKMDVDGCRHVDRRPGRKEQDG